MISATLIIRPRAASTLIQPKTLMGDNEPHSFSHCLPDTEQRPGDCSYGATIPYSPQIRKATTMSCADLIFSKCLALDVFALESLEIL